MRTLGIIQVFVLLSMATQLFAEEGHNHVHIDQTGDNLVMDILQSGKDQHIDLDLGLQYGNVDNLTMWIGQLGTRQRSRIFCIRRW